MMRGARRHRRDMAALLGGATAIMALAVTPAAWAAEHLAQAPTETQTQAPTGEALAFSIPPQPLAAALERFAEQAGVAFAYRTEGLEGLASPGVRGSLTRQEALGALLAGTGVVFQFTGPSSVVLEKVDGGGAMVLDPVTVEGAGLRRAESAVGPVGGYVARRSATATKSDTPLAETPQSLSVVGAEEMEARNVQTLEDAIKYTPGVFLTYGATGDSRSSWYTVRGFPVTSTFYRDGLVVSGQNWQRLDSSLIERVEILRGPASVLYGQSVPGGLINTVSKRPQEVQAGAASVEYGTSDWKRVEGDVTGPLDAAGTWLYRLTAAVHDSGGMNRLEHDRNDRVLFAPALTWRPTDRTGITLALAHQQDDSRGWTPAVRRRTALGTTDRFTYLGEPDYDDYHQEQSHVSILADHALSDTLTVSLATRYSNINLDYRQMWPGDVRADGRTLDRSIYGAEQDAEVLVLDARINGKVSGLGAEHSLTAGVDYLYQDRDNASAWVADTPIDIFNPVYGTHGSAVATPAGDGDIRSPGLYVQDQIAIGEHWAVLLGGRQDLAGSSAANPYESAFTSRAGVAYKTDFGLVPYASYAESFEPQSGTGWGGAAFDPTEGRQYEIGVKYEPPGLNAMATLALFDLRKQNVLTPDPVTTHVCNGGPCSVQTGEVRSRGVELGLTMGLAEGLNAVAAYTYNPIDVSKSNVPGEVGRQLADTPIHTASAWIDYDIQGGPLAGLGLGGGLRFVGKTEDAASTMTTSAQIIDEAMVRYQVDDWRLSLNVKNLFDREIPYSCTRGPNEEFCYLNEPLTVTARVTRTF